METKKDIRKFKDTQEQTQKKTFSKESFEQHRTDYIKIFYE